MGFYYAREKQKFDAEWERLSAWYQAEGMSAEAIKELINTIGRSSAASVRLGTGRSRSRRSQETFCIRNSRSSRPG